MALLVISAAFAAVMAGYALDSAGMYLIGIAVLSVQWFTSTKGAAKAAPDAPKSKTL